jgi:hypothetical protein
VFQDGSGGLPTYLLSISQRLNEKNYNRTTLAIGTGSTRLPLHYSKSTILSPFRQPPSAILLRATSNQSIHSDKFQRPAYNTEELYKRTLQVPCRRLTLPAVRAIQLVRASSRDCKKCTTRQGSSILSHRPYGPTVQD